MSIMMPVDPRSLPRPNRIPHGDICRLPTAKASAATMFALNCLHLGQVTYSAALLRLANESAGCMQEDETQCQARIMSFSHGSFVFLMGMVWRVAAVFMFPLIGAWMDSSPYRRQCYLSFSLLILGVFVAEVFVTKETWIVFAIIEGSMVSVSQLVTICFYAYFLDLRHKTTTSKIIKLSSTVWSVGFMSQLLMMVLLIVISLLLNLGEVDVGRTTRLVSIVWFGVPAMLAYKFYPDVPTLRDVPEQETSKWKDCFRRVTKTLYQLRSSERAFGLRRFFVAVIFANATMQGTISLTGVYFKEFFGLDGTQFGYNLLAISVAMLMGSIFSDICATKTDPLLSWRYSIASLSIILLLGLVGFYRRSTPFPFLVSWSLMVGFSTGWYYAGKLACFSTIVPVDSPAELAGIMSFCEVCISWVPLFLFNFLVYFDVAHNWAAFPLCGFGLVASMVLVSNNKSWREIRVANRIEDADDGTPHENSIQESPLDSTHVASTNDKA